MSECALSSFVLALSVVEVQCIQIILSDLEGASAEVTLLTALKHRESLAAENTAALLITIPVNGITRSNIVRVCVVYAAIIADIFVTAYTDPLQTTEVLTHILLLGLQIFLVLVIMLAFFLLTTSLSLHVQLGLYDKYLRQHRGVFTLSLLTVLLVASMGAYRLVLVYKTTPYLMMWQQPGYLAVWMMQRTSLLALHCTAAYATAMSFKRPQQSWLLNGQSC